MAIRLKMKERSPCFRLGKYKKSLIPNEVPVTNKGEFIEQVSGQLQTKSYTLEPTVHIII